MATPFKHFAFRLSCTSCAMLLIIFPSVQHVDAAQAKPPILEQALRALGGRAALERVATLQATGRIILLSGFSGRYELKAQQPNRILTSWDIGYISQQRAFDGAHGWEKNASVRELARDALERVRDEAVWMPLLRYAKADTPLRVTELRASANLATDVDIDSKPLPDRYRLDFATASGLVSVLIDAHTFLPLQIEQEEPFEEGRVLTIERFADFRTVGSLKLPFHIQRVVPDLPSDVRIEHYVINPALSAKDFSSPNAAHAGEPYQLSLATIPHRVFRTPRNQFDAGWKRYWGIPFPPMERWIVDFIVDERFGRYVVPERATVSYYAKERLMSREVITGAALAALVKFPVTRFAPQSEIYNFRSNGLQYANLQIDRVRLEFEGRDPESHLLKAQMDVPLEAAPTDHPILFPVRGPFVVRTGHDYQELSHTYEWSQQFAYDITCVGPNFELTTGDKPPRRNEDFVAFGTCEILAPDAGVIVYARNDVSDDSSKAEHLRMSDPLWTIAGNIVLIDHQNGTYSLLAHMREGSVQVRIGDHVSKGQLIGRLGASGAPGFPHVHFQLQTSKSLFDGDGVPVVFGNIKKLNGDSVGSPEVGGFYIAE